MCSDLSLSIARRLLSNLTRKRKALLSAISAMVGETGPVCVEACTWKALRFVPRPEKMEDNK
jgi:hypothetical protein